MDVIRWQKIEEIFNATLELPAEKRSAFLDSVCCDDQTLRAEINTLLSEAAQPDKFLSESCFAQGARLLSDAHLKSSGGETFGNYTTIRRIGHGGMGEIYLARDERLGRRVAIKLLPKRLIEDEDCIRRFRHEARAASAISHSNIAHVYEIGESHGQLFTVMEFVSGMTLRERISREPLKLGEVVDIATQVALGIAAAHAQGIIHRDIKPENIMIRRDGVVKVVDFGLAKLSEPQRESLNDNPRDTQIGARLTQAGQTEPGMLLGTATYMSPEQARGNETDARTDIWSWGVVFYEMLAGEPPFAGATNSDVIAEILKSDPSFAQTIFSYLPETATTMLRRTLSKDRSGRYGKMTELIAVLRELHKDIESKNLLECFGVSNRGAESASESETSGGHLEAKPHSAPAAPVFATSLSSEAISNDPSKSLSTSSVPPFPRTKKFVISAVVILALVTVAILLLSRSNLMHRRVPSRSSIEIIHLTNDGRVMDAAISPDARLLAYVPIQSGKQSLRVRDLESGENWELLPPDPSLCWGMRFALNNQSVFYVSKQPSSTVSVLYRIPVHGGTSQKLVVNIDSPPGLSPDNMQIAFIRSFPGQHRDALIVANVDGSSEREILSRAHPDRLALAGVTWAPDGKMVAVGASRHDDTEAAVLGVPVEGGAPFEITPWKWSAIRGVVWKNDGRTILFSAHLPNSNALQIWRATYPDKVVDPVTTDDNQYEEATLGPNLLLATHTYEIADLWLVQRPDVFDRLTTDGHNGADGLTLTRRKVIYTVGEYSSSQLWSMNFDGTHRQLLTKNYGVRPSAAKDGDLIAYVSLEGGTHHIWLVNSDGHNNHQLTHGGGEDDPHMSPDGKWVFYVSRAEGRGALWKIPTSGGKSVQLTFAGMIMNPVISPDGKKVACTYRRDEGDRWKIAILPINGGVPSMTFALPSSFYQLIRWTPESNGFTYLDKQNGAQNIWRQPLNGSAAVQLTQFKDDSILDYDRAGEHQFIASRGGRRRDIVLIRNID